jgi:hypothetical protein
MRFRLQTILGRSNSRTPKCRNVKMAASSRTTSLLQRHVTFRDFGVFNAKCPSCLSSRFSKCRTLKCRNDEIPLQRVSVAPAASHPMAHDISYFFHKVSPPSISSLPLRHLYGCNLRVVFLDLVIRGYLHY